MTNLKFLILCLLGKERYFPIQIKRTIEWAGNTNCGFYIVPALLTNKKSVVYSFGVGEDVSFDEYLINKFNCNIYAYDPTPKSKIFIQKKNMPSSFHYFDIGIANYDGTAKFYLPENPDYVSCTTYNRWGYDEKKVQPISVNMKRLVTLMRENNHTKIDLLKMDIEGSEYDVIDDIIKSNIDIKQLCIEDHHRFQGIGIKKTIRMVDSLNKAGYYIAAISESREEFTFVRINKQQAAR